MCYTGNTQNSPEKSNSSFLPPVSAHHLEQHQRETASQSDQGYSRSIEGSHREGLKPAVWRQCGRGEVPRVCGSKPRQVEEQEKQSMLGWWAACSTVGEPTRALSRAAFPLSSEVPLPKGQQQPVLLLVEFCLLPQKLPPPHPFPLM